MYFYTYKITNLSNGKIYIGVHKTKNLDDGYMGSGTTLAKAKQKYGIENFHKDILMFHDTEDDMFEIESLIVDSEFIKRKDVYNVKLGGQGGWDYLNSDKTSMLDRLERGRKTYKLVLQSETGYKDFKEKYSPVMKAKWQEPSYRNKVISSLKATYTNGHHWAGRTHKQETKEKISSSCLNAAHQKGEKNSQFGKMWIHSLIERRSIRINKDDPIPDGWSKGRKMFK